MTKLSLLRAFSKILFAIFLVFLVLMPGFSIMRYAMPHSIPDSITIGNLAGSHTAWLLGLLLKGCITIYTIYMFREILESFSKKIFFDDMVIKYFDRIGKCLLCLLLLEELPTLITSIYNCKLNLSIPPLYILFILIVSLFFMVLSEVFKTAKNLREENDLTI